MEDITLIAVAIIAFTTGYFSAMQLLEDKIRERYEQKLKYVVAMNNSNATAAARRAAYGPINPPTPKKTAPAPSIPSVKSSPVINLSSRRNKSPKDKK